MRHIVSNTTFVVVLSLLVVGLISVPFWFVYFVSLAWHMGAQ